MKIQELKKGQGRPKGSTGIKHGVVDRHPKRQAIIDDIMQGVPLKTIAIGLYPPVSVVALSRFRRLLLQPAVQAMPRSAANAAIKEIMDLQTAEGLAKYKAQVKMEIEQSLAKQAERRERWINAAERVPVRDGEGNEIGVQMDHRALSSHEGNMLRSIDLRGKVAGLFDADGASQVGVSIQLTINNPASATGVTAVGLGLDPDNVKTIDIKAVRK